VLGAAEMCCERSVALEGGLGDVFCEFLCFLISLFDLIWVWVWVWKGGEGRLGISGMDRWMGLMKYRIRQTVELEELRERNLISRGS
jgi:hypothetical protein